jgi:hypothetical protein
MTHLFRVTERWHPKEEFLTDVRQTKELARSSRSSSFLSEHLVFFSESQLDAFLLETSRPFRTSPVFLVLSEHLSSCNLFILFIVLFDVCCSLKVLTGDFYEGVVFPVLYSASEGSGGR